jgi:tRNA-dihydrouridine synthase B
MIADPVTTLKPFYIGGIAVQTPLTLAPMAGHTNMALRLLVRELGDCGLVCTEVMSSAALENKGVRQRSLEIFNWDNTREHPVAVQLFGANPQVMAEAARIVVDAGAAIVDINMGCWVPKVAKTGAGAALLRDVCTATTVVDAVVNAVSVPVTVKVRSGYEDGVVTAIPFARAAQQSGVQAIAVHARFAGQGHSGSADWDVIQQVKATVPDLPVIGNGDVRSGADAARMFAHTGCDGVMIGRGALGRPWIFRHVAHYLRSGELLPEPSRTERARIALRHAELTLQTTGLRTDTAIRELRGQLSKYHLDEGESVEIRNRIVRVESMQEICAILEPLARG